MNVQFSQVLRLDMCYTVISQQACSHSYVSSTYVGILNVSFPIGCSLNDEFIWESSGGSTVTIKLSPSEIVKADLILYPTLHLKIGAKISGLVKS